MAEDIKDFKPIKWEDLKKNQRVWIPGNLVNGKPTKVYGIHRVHDISIRVLKSGTNGSLFHEGWTDVLYIPKDIPFVLLKRLRRFTENTDKVKIRAHEGSDTIILFGPEKERDRGVKTRISIWECSAKELTYQKYEVAKTLIDHHKRMFPGGESLRYEPKYYTGYLRRD